MTGEWISVNERLPEHINDVLTISIKDKTIWMGRHTAKGQWQLYFSDNGRVFDRYRSDNITHWMPLPEPPTL